MLHRTVLALAVVLALSCLTATTAIASTRCLCNNGMTVQSMDDDGDDDDCNDACDGFGGGKVWTPSDAEFEGSGDDDAVVRRPREEVVRPAGPGAIERRR